MADTYSGPCLFILSGPFKAIVAKDWFVYYVASVDRIDLVLLVDDRRRKSSDGGPSGDR